MGIMRDSFIAGCRVLIDNGIEIDKAETVLQALCHVMLDTETEPFMTDVSHPFPCCQNCTNVHAVCNETNYRQCTIHDLTNWVHGGKVNL